MIGLEVEATDSVRIHRVNERDVASDSDEVLMVRVAEGNAAAFEILYDRWRGRIATFIARMIGDRETAEDLTQEVFLRVCRSPRSFDPRGRFMTWIYAVARNLCIDYLRMKRLPTLTASAPDGASGSLEPAGPADAEPEHRTLQSEVDSRVMDIVAGLSKKLREVFILCAIQGLSYEEVAGIVRCPVKTVSSRLSRARERFAAAFEAYLSSGTRAGAARRPVNP